MSSNKSNNPLSNPKKLETKIKLSRTSRPKESNFFEDGFDENLIGDDKDKEYLDSLTQLEREKIIAKRHHKREQSRFRKNIFSLVTNKNSSFDKKSLTAKIVPEKISRLGMLTEESPNIQEASNRDSKKSNRIKEEDESSSDSDSDSDSNSESESETESESEYESERKIKSKQDSDEDFEMSSSEWTKNRKTKRIKKIKDRKPDQKRIRLREKTKQSPVVRFRHREISNKESLEIHAAKHFELLNKICVKREFLGKLSNRPYFDKTIQHCLVKVNFSTVRGNQYRIGIIRKVVVLPEEEYELNGKTHCKYLEVYFSSGEAQNRVAMANVSNRPIDESEAFQLLVKLKDFPEKTLDLKWIEAKKNNILEMLDFRMTPTEIDNLIQERLKADSSVSLF